MGNETYEILPFPIKDYVCHVIWLIPTHKDTSVHFQIAIHIVQSIHSQCQTSWHGCAIYFQFIPTWGFPGLEGRHLFINLWKISINFINNPLYHQLTSTSLFFNIDAHPPARYQNQDVDLMLCEMKIAENKKNCYRKRNKWMDIHWRYISLVLSRKHKINEFHVVNNSVYIRFCSLWIFEYFLCK